MTEKLKDYQVLDVLCGGTFYKVRHKVTNKIFAWKAVDCSLYTADQIQGVTDDVKAIHGVRSDALLRYYNTILHAPSSTLYFVLEYSPWRTLEELIAICEAEDKYIAESFTWRLLRELARVSKAVEELRLVALRKCVTPASILVGDGCEVRINCAEVCVTSAGSPGLMRQVGDVIHALCYRRGDNKQFQYSDDLRDVVAFLTDDKNSNLRPDVVLYHPTVLANLETQAGPQTLSSILLPLPDTVHNSDANKCDAEKAVELCKAIKPVPRTHFNFMDSPIYCNVSPKRKLSREIEDSNSARNSLSPTIAALALELPGFVPRSRKPVSQALQSFKPQKVSEDTLSQQWMTRLITLRQREESLNQRERDLIKKEIVSSPATKIIPLNESIEPESSVVDPLVGSNGITLPPLIPRAEDSQWVSRRRRRSGSARRPRRKSLGYQDLDSSLSADPGDGSIIVTAKRITKDNMPRRNIFPEVSTKKVHFTSSNPFVESDESVTLTFYELENVDGNGYQVPRLEAKGLKDITKFKYLDIEKLASEKRAAMQQWTHSSPSKQAKMSKVFKDVTNTDGIKRSPSKASLTSKGSSSSRYSMASGRSQWSIESASSKVSEGAVSERTIAVAHTPVVLPEVKKNKRKSLLNFKTPFKFMTSTKI